MEFISPEFIPFRYKTADGPGKLLVILLSTGLKAARTSLWPVTIPKSSQIKVMSAVSESFLKICKFCHNFSVCREWSDSTKHLVSSISSMIVFKKFANIHITHLLTIDKVLRWKVCQLYVNVMQVATVMKTLPTLMISVQLIQNASNASVFLKVQSSFLSSTTLVEPIMTQDVIVTRLCQMLTASVREMRLASSANVWLQVDNIMRNMQTCDKTFRLWLWWKPPKCRQLLRCKWKV